MQARKFASGFEARGLLLPRQQRLESHGLKTKRLHWPVAVFLIALIVPWIFYFGQLRMSVYRIILLLMLLPCLGMWLSGKAGRIRIPDFTILLYSCWIILGLAVTNDLESSIKSSGIICIETLGPYLLARCYIRSADDFYNIARLLFRIVVLLLPFAAFEFFSGRNISRELFQLFLPTFDGPQMPPRSGLTRVQSVFDHPILFGAFTGIILALVYLVLGYKKDFRQRAAMTGIVCVTSMMSLSSGPLVGLIAQGFLLCWNDLFIAIRFRWKLLIALVSIVTLTIEFAANRSALNIIISYFLFDPISYWGRQMIWDYGTASVLNYPFFGTGLNDWQRPPWLGSGSSIDNFWLFVAVMFGLPAVCLMSLTFFSIFLAVSFKKGLDNRVAVYRTAFLITMAAFFLVAWTVHFWDTAYAMFLFLMGSGVWMLDVKAESRLAPEEQRV